MALTPSERALTLGQLQTPSNQVGRSAARGGGVVPALPSQQFSIQAGLEQLTDAEQGALRKVVARLRARQQGAVRAAGVGGVGAGVAPILRQAFGAPRLEAQQRATQGVAPTFGGKRPIPSALGFFGAF